MAEIVLQKTEGYKRDILLYDDDTVVVNGQPVPEAVVTHIGDAVTVALDPTNLSELQIDTREEADELAA